MYKSYTWGVINVLVVGQKEMKVCPMGGGIRQKFEEGETVILESALVLPMPSPMFSHFTKHQNYM
jgi:hypothetical protein